MNASKTALGLPALAILACVGLSAPAHAAPATDLNCKGCVDKKDLAKNAVDSSRIKDGSIKPQDLYKSAQPGGGAFSEHVSDTATTDLTELWQAIRQFTMDVPSNGVIIANASAQLVFGNTASQYAGCTLSDVMPATPGSDLEPYMIQEGNSTIRYHTIALTRAFKVKAGETTIYLFCKETAVAYSVGITRQVLTAHFVPNAYGPTESD